MSRTHSIATEVIVVTMTEAASTTAEQLKEAGNEAFKAGRLDEARSKYTDALAAPSAAGALRATLLSNRAACLLKAGEAAAALRDCDAALALDGTAADAVRVKALFRRAGAKEALGDNQGAFADLQARDARAPRICGGARFSSGRGGARCARGRRARRGRDARGASAVVRPVGQVGQVGC